jgi:hypothetical protein
MRFPINKRPIEYINGNPYLICAIIPIENCKNVSLIKEWLGADTAFKVQREGKYWFCETIQEINYEPI